MRDRQAADIVDVRDDNGDLDALEPPFTNGMGNGYQVGAAAGDEDSQPEGSLPDGLVRALRSFIVRDWSG